MTVFKRSAVTSHNVCTSICQKSSCCCSCLRDLGFNTPLQIKIFSFVVSGNLGGQELDGADPATAQGILGLDVCTHQLVCRSSWNHILQPISLDNTILKYIQINISIQASIDEDGVCAEVADYSSPIHSQTILFGQQYVGH